VRVAIIGTGLIGGSVGLALVGRGHEVAGFDLDDERLDRAKQIGAVSTVCTSLEAAVAGSDLVILAVPVGHVVEVASAALDAGGPIVTDVGSVKGPIVAAMEQARPESVERFVGGHPMAGSEQDGIDGANAALFVGATWVLTPTPATDAGAYTRLRTTLQSLGAEVVSVTPDHHDLLVALVSHVPQLAASTLMDVATAHEEEHRALLRLAAGGFRDMTRIAASQPAIWLDILTSNRNAVLDALDAYLDGLQAARELVAEGDREGLRALLDRARGARRNLPVGASIATDLVELRVPVPDRPGVLAEVTTTAGRLGVNVANIDIAHSLEGRAGVIELVIAAHDAPALEEALHELGYHTSRTELT
jgi:prephenate dehydrogenase